MKKALQLRTHRPCPTCSGSGSIASPELVGLSILRRIETRAVTGSLSGVRVELHPELADALQNERRQELAALEREFDIEVEIVAASGLHRAEEEIEWRQRPKTEDRVGTPAVSAADLGEDLGRHSGQRKESKKAEAQKSETAGEKETTAADQEKTKRRRRGGRRRKKSPADTNSAENGNSELAIEETDESTQIPVAGSDEDEVKARAKKPRRRRPRRSRKKATADETAPAQKAPKKKPKKEIETAPVPETPSGKDPFSY